MIAGAVAALLLVVVIVGVIVAVRSGEDSTVVVKKHAAAVNKATCIERHLKSVGILEKGYRSVHTNDTGSSEADCEPLIQELRQKSFEPFKTKIESDPNNKPLQECLIPGLAETDIADQGIAMVFFDKDNMNDPARFEKANQDGAGSVMKATLKCAMGMQPNWQMGGFM